MQNKAVFVLVDLQTNLPTTINKKYPAGNIWQKE
jgi:hypothetical protein